MELYTTVDPFPPNVDWDSAALSYHPKFVTIIEKSRTDIAAGRTMSLEEMKRAVLPQRSLKLRPGRATRKAR